MTLTEPLAFKKRFFPRTIAGGKGPDFPTRTALAMRGYRGHAPASSDRSFPIEGPVGHRYRIGAKQMSDPKKTDPRVFWWTVAGLAALALFAAYVWFGVYVLGISPHCHMSSGRGPLNC